MKITEMKIGDLVYISETFFQADSSPQGVFGRIIGFAPNRVIVEIVTGSNKGLSFFYDPLEIVCRKEMEKYFDDECERRKLELLNAEYKYKISQKKKEVLCQLLSTNGK